MIHQEKLKKFIVYGLLFSFISLLVYSQNTGPSLDDPPFTKTDTGNIRKPVSPTRITSNMQLPLESHSWRTNLYFDPQDWASSDLYPEWISMIADPMTAHIDKTGGGAHIVAMHLLSVLNYGGANPHFRFAHDAADALIVNPLAGTNAVAKLDDYSDWGAKLTWENGKMEAFLNNGSPYVFFHSNDGGISITTRWPASIWYNQGNAIGLQVEIDFHDKWGNQAVHSTDNYVLFAPQGSTWSISQDDSGKLTLTSTLNGKNYCSVSSVPHDTKRIENLNYFERHHSLYLLIDTRHQEENCSYSLNMDFQG